MSANPDATEALRLLLHVHERVRQATIVSEAFARAWIAGLKREADNRRMWADYVGRAFSRPLWWNSSFGLATYTRTRTQNSAGKC